MEYAIDAKIFKKVYLYSVFVVSVENVILKRYIYLSA